MSRADLSAPRPLRIGVMLVVVLIHIAAFVGLLRAFAPDLTNQVVKSVTAVFTVTVTTPQPTPTPDRSAAAAEEEGAAAAAGKKAKPKEVAAPKPKVAIAEAPAPEAASTGNEYGSGARDRGEGTGAGGEGQGTGSGDSGTGQGGGGSKAAKTSGDINSARDYPKKSRDLRIGDYVIVALTVGTDGRVKACRIHRASRDPDADRITCELATKRFRFRPATDARGRPVESVYGWKQRWFYPGKK